MQVTELTDWTSWHKSHSVQCMLSEVGVKKFRTTAKRPKTSSVITFGKYYFEVLNGLQSLIKDY